MVDEVVTQRRFLMVVTPVVVVLTMTLPTRQQRIQIQVTVVPALMVEPVEYRALVAVVLVAPDIAPVMAPD
jgi:hypothetical protein